MFVCSLVTASAVRDYSFQLSIANENAATNVCTDAESQDLENRVLPTILSVMANPKYDLKPTRESDWKRSKSHPAPNRKERELQYCSSCRYCHISQGGNQYLCDNFCRGCPLVNQRLLRSQRELAAAKVSEIKSNTEGAIRGLLNKFANASPYWADCTNALIEATIGSTMDIV